MTEKRFEVHKFIEGFPVAVELIDSYAKELVEQGKDLADVTIDIHDNYRKQINGCGKNMTLKECCDLLNELHEENKIFRLFIELNDFDVDEILLQGRGFE